MQTTFFQWLLDWRSWADSVGRIALVSGVLAMYLVIPTFWRGGGIALTEPSEYSRMRSHK